MRKLLLVVLLASSPLFCQTAAVTGNLAAPDNTAVGTRTFVRFELKNTGGQQCKVAGVALVTPFIKDFTPNVSGALSFNILRNDQITCGTQAGQTQWAFTLFRDGTPGAPCFTQITTSSVNLNSLTCTNTVAVVTPPTGDTTYLRLDGANATTAANPFHWVNPITVPKVNGFYAVDGTTYTTLQQAVTAACAAGGGTIYVGPGTFAIPATMCSQINIIAAGRGQSDATACPTTLTYAGSGDAFALLGMNHISITNACLKYTGASTTAVAVHAQWGQFITMDKVYFQGWGVGLKLNCVEGQGTAGYNSFSNGHMTTMATGGTGTLLDSTGCTNQTVNNDYFYNWNSTGGTGGTSWRVQGSGNTIANEIIVIGGQFTTPGGTGISLQNACCRNITFIGCDVEGNLQGVTIGTGNSGTFMSCNISANGNNSAAANLVDNSAGGVVFPRNNIAGWNQVYNLDAAGNFRILSLSFGAAALPCGGNNICAVSGSQLGASGAFTIEFDNTGTKFLLPIFLANLLISPTPPTISSGFGTSPAISNSNGTAAFTVNVGGGGAASSGIVGLPTSATGWLCSVNNMTAAAAHRADNTRQTNFTTTTVTLENQTTSTGVALAWTANDLVRLNCSAI